MKYIITFITLLAAIHAAETLSTPSALWKEYDPDHGDFKEEIVKQETQNGIFHRDSYISAYVLGEEIRVYCRYSVKVGAAKAPGLSAFRIATFSSEESKVFCSCSRASRADGQASRRIAAAALEHTTKLQTVTQPPIKK